MPLRQSKLIEVRQVKKKGRGVFARYDIAEGTEVERCPVLVIPESDIWYSTLADYVFEWGDGTVGLTLGYGSMYNHSFQPNARYEDVGRQSKAYIAIRDIEAGEEITINYNGDPDDTTSVGFEVLE